MCQGCVDSGELTQQTYDAIRVFLHEWPNAEFGPGHITLSDCNVLDRHIDFCLNEARDNTQQYIDLGHNKAEIDATVKFLEQLRAIPEDSR